jgi:hypothetical protein
MAMRQVTPAASRAFCSHVTNSWPVLALAAFHWAVLLRTYRCAGGAVTCENWRRCLPSGRRPWGRAYRGRQSPSRPLLVREDEHQLRQAFQFSLRLRWLYCWSLYLVREHLLETYCKFQIQFALIVEVNRQCRHPISNMRHPDCVSWKPETTLLSSFTYLMRWYALYAFCMHCF